MNRNNLREYWQHALHTAMLLISYLSVLMGCNPSSLVSSSYRIEINGVVVDAAKTSVTTQAASFDCQNSRSGHCYYIILSKDCQVKGNAACESEVIDRFSVPVGDVKEVASYAMPVNYCVDFQRTPEANHCKRS